ncbi:MAG TPA: DUF1801 domain-containing protein [Polyangiaceae bacterium]|nr:DUF1801 domain-containing protein [Polyangiaceae bacterium]
MPSSGPSTVDEYIATFPSEVQSRLEKVRRAIVSGLPKTAEPCISYRIAAFRVDGRVAIYFAGWKEHYSIYPASESLVGALGDRLAGYEVQKGTIRFPLKAAVPTGLIRAIAAFRAAETQSRRRVVPVSKKAAAKASLTKKSASKKSVAKKAPTKKSAAKKAPAKKSAAKKAPAKKPRSARPLETRPLEARPLETRARAVKKR